MSEQTFYRWRAEYGGLRIDQARRLKQMETENGQIKRAAVEVTLDNQILKETAAGNFWAPPAVDTVSNTSGVAWEIPSGGAARHWGILDRPSATGR